MMDMFGKVEQAIVEKERNRLSRLRVFVKRYIKKLLMQTRIAGARYVFFPEKAYFWIYLQKSR